MSLEAITILIETNAKLAQTNRELWDYIHKNKTPNQENHEHLVAVCREILGVLEGEEKRNITQEIWYRQLKETLTNIKTIDMDRNNSP